MWPSTKPVSACTRSRPAGEPRTSRIWSTISLVRDTSSVQSRKNAWPISDSRTAARGAMEQRAAEQVFELLHARGDHRLRQAQLARRFGETLRLRHAHEGFDAEEAVHASV